jgi:hypothetical protein
VEYFCNQDWTGFFDLPVGQFAGKLSRSKSCRFIASPAETMCFRAQPCRTAASH